MVGADPELRFVKVTRGFFPDGVNVIALAVGQTSYIKTTPPTMVMAHSGVNPFFFPWKERTPLSVEGRGLKSPSLVAHTTPHTYRWG